MTQHLQVGILDSVFWKLQRHAGERSANMRTHRFRPIWPLLVCQLCAMSPLLKAGELFKDDFSRFPPRIFSEPVKQLTNAIHEYHYLPNRGVSLEPWANALIHDDAWVGGDEEGKPYLEQHLLNSRPQHYNSILVVGDPEWADYTVEVRVKPLSIAGMAGVVFRYHTNRHYYLFALTSGKKARLALRLPLEKEYRVAEWKELAAADFSYEPTRSYALKVENTGAKIRAAIDGKLVLEASDDEVLKGKTGVTANVPARFQDFLVSTTDDTERQIRVRIAAREDELARLRAENPRPKLWKRFNTPGFGAGRNARFGDLDGDGVVDMLIGQNVRKVSANSFDHISCLTAVNFDGKVLWQIGRPDPYNDVLANDTPFQIYDIDQDGRNDVVLVRDFKLQILDGRSGAVRRWVWMPRAPLDNKQRPYEFEVGDSIYFLNLTGSPRPEQILIKDRYRNFWVFDNDLRLRFSGQGDIGHYPYALDVDGDGRQEFMIGHAMWGPDGKQLWSRDGMLKDHADGVVLGNFSGEAGTGIRAYSCSSDEGYVMFDISGSILKHVRIGHAQSPSVAKYRPDLPGLQLMTVNFWWNPGIITLFDHEGNILAQQEPIHSGSPLLPVNWRGDGQEFAMLSGNVREGGMIDGQLRRVVMFPDDGHPDMAYNVMDVTGDARDEIILWDQQRVWIYTQDRPFTGRRIHAPVRNPAWNESNYQTTVSMPAWKYFAPGQ